MPEFVGGENSERYITVKKICPWCHNIAEIRVLRDQYNAWKSGVLAQDAFPNLSASEREIIISGTHPKCWDEMWKEDDE